jgi:hypothetical protein
MFQIGDIFHPNENRVIENGARAYCREIAMTRLDQMHFDRQRFLCVNRRI